jgi:hypothetical protein
MVKNEVSPKDKISKECLGAPAQATWFLPNTFADPDGGDGNDGDSNRFLFAGRKQAR